VATDKPRPTNPRYYGWYIALALAISETVSWGILYYSFSVFQVPMEKELGATRAQLSGAFSVALLLSGLAALPVGWWIDRRGARGLMTVGSLCAVALVWAWSRVEDLNQLYLVLSGIGLTMAAVLYDPAFAVITAWFVRYRRRALTLLTLMAGLASTIFLPLANWLLIQQGWRWALVTLAIILFIVTVPLHAFVLRRRPQDEGLLPDGETLRTKEATTRPLNPRSATTREALRSVSFWSLTASFILSSAVGVAVGLHFIPYLIEHGYSSTFAASVAGLIGFMQVVGRVFFAPLSRWLRRQWLVAGILLIQAVALLTLISLRETVGVIVFVILFGMTNGVLTLARAASIADFYGPNAYGSINGVLSFWTTLARAAGPLILAFLYTSAGQYEMPFVFLVGVTGLAALAYYIAEHQLEREQTIWAALPGSQPAE
jgi:MFS family permease